MKKTLQLHPIGFIQSSFPHKFGIPRQGAVIPELKGEVCLEKEYQKDGILRDLSSFSHMWIIWGFSENFNKDWTPTIRPPRLGGTKRVGVFASRSPNRPNPLGMTAVKIEEVDEKNFIIRFSGADMMDGTPVYDIKPYVPYADCIPADNGYAVKPDIQRMHVAIPKEIQEQYPDRISILKEILSCDPLPAYQKDPDRIYGFTYEDLEIKFKAKDDQITVISIDKK